MPFDKELLEQIRQGLRVALSNPYDVLSSLQKQSFEERVKNFYKTFPEKEYLVFTPNPIEISEMAGKLKQKTGIDIVATDTDYWERLKIWETLVRTGDVGKNIEFIKLAGIFNSEIDNQLDEVKKKLTEEKDPIKRATLLKELKKVSNFEKALGEIIRRRNELIRSVFETLRQKDEILNQMINKTLERKILRPLDSLNDANIRNSLLEEVEKFTYNTIDEIRSHIAKGTIVSYLRGIREELEKDKRFKKFTKGIGVYEDKIIKKNARHLIFFYKLLQLEDALYLRIEKELEKKLDNFEVLKDKPLSDKIEIWRDLKNDVEDKALKEDIDKLMEIYEAFKSAKSEQNSLFLSEKGGNTYGTIEKYFNYSQATHKKLLNTLVKLHNLDLTLWKIYKRELTPSQLERVLNTPEFEIDLRDNTKESIVKFYNERVKSGKNPQEYYLDPYSYSLIIKSIAFKEYAFSQRDKYLSLQLKKAKEQLKTNLVNGIHEISRIVAHQAGSRLIGLKGDVVADCIERALTSENFEKEIENCYNKHIKQKIEKIENLSRLIENKIGFSIQGVFFAPVYLGVLIVNDIQKVLAEQIKEDFKRIKKETEKTIEKLVYDLDDEERDKEVRKYIYRHLSFWSKITNVEFTDDVKGEIYAELLKDKLDEILKEKKKWDLVIENLAKRVNAYKDDNEIVKEFTKRLKTAVQKRDETLISMATKLIMKEVENTEFNDPNLKREILNTIADINSRKTTEEVKSIKIANLINLLEKERLFKNDRQILNSVLRKINLEFTTRELKKENNRLINEMKEAVFKELKGAKNPIEFFEKLKKSKYKYGKAIFEVGEVVSRLYKQDLERLLSDLKKQTLVIENPQTKKALVLVLNNLSNEDKELMQFNRDKILIKLFGKNERQIEEMLTREIDHGLEYKMLIDDFYRQRYRQGITPKRKKEHSISPNP